jgi:TolB-like protein
MGGASVILIAVSLAACAAAHEATPIVAVGELEVAATDRAVSRIARGITEELYTAIGREKGIDVAVRHGLRPLIDEATLSKHGKPARAADFTLSGKLTQEGDGGLRLVLELATRSGTRRISAVRYTVQPVPPFTDLDLVLPWVRQTVGAGEQGVRRIATRPGSETSVAVLPFGYVDGRGGRTAFGDVIAGLAAIEIDNVPGVHCVDRENLGRVWEELALHFSSQAKRETTSGLEGADLFLCGSYSVHDGSLRLLVRLVDPGAGLVLAANVQEGRWEDIGKAVRSATRRGTSGRVRDAGNPSGTCACRDCSG